MAKRKLSPTRAVENARKELAKAEAAHRASFREDLAKLFTQYGLKLVPNVGDEMLILTHDGEFTAEELPE